MKKTESFNVQVNKEMINQAKAMDINMRAAVKQLFEKVTKTKICPCCGAKLEGK